MTGGCTRSGHRQVALEHPDKSARQLAWHITDTEVYFISESSVYRILKGFDLVSSPVFQMVSAKDKYEKPTRRVNELWQTDFTHMKVQGWGWYYLSTVLDDYSRYILAWRLSKTMGAQDVQHTLEWANEENALSGAFSQVAGVGIPSLVRQDRRTADDLQVMSPNPEIMALDRQVGVPRVALRFAIA